MMNRVQSAPTLCFRHFHSRQSDVSNPLSDRALAFCKTPPIGLCILQEHSLEYFAAPDGPGNDVVIIEQHAAKPPPENASKFARV